MSAHQEDTAKLSSLIEKFRKPNSSITTYLNSAAESLFYQPHVDAFELYASCKTSGSEGRPELTKIENETRKLVANLIGVASETVIFLSSTSRCLDVAIKSINWEPGDNIVFSDTEFLTTEFTGALLQQHGIGAKIVSSSNGYLTPEDYDREIDSRTKLVVASSVSYKTGLILDIEGVSRVTRAKGALLFMDGIQGLGSVETKANYADFFASGTFKWLFGMHGISIFYVNPLILEKLEVPYVGYHSVTNMFTPNRTSEFELWPDTRRFQEGLPNYAGICLLRNSLLAIEEVGIENIFKKNKSLMKTLLSELDKLGLQPFGHDMPDRHSPIVAFETPDFERIGTSLIKAGIIIWAKDGRVRTSPHFYNSEADISRLTESLKTFL